MYKLLFLFLLGFLIHTGVYAQTDSIQTEQIKGRWIMFEIRNTDSSMIDFSYDGDKVPPILTDIKFTKKKAISNYRGDSRAARWIIRNGSLYFYFDLIQTEQVYKIISIRDTELKLQKTTTLSDGTLVIYTIVYKRK